MRERFVVTGIVWGALFAACSTAREADTDVPDPTEAGTTEVDAALSPADASADGDGAAPVDSGRDADDAGTDADADGGADAGTGVDAGPPITYVHYDVNHIISTGQSDAVANGAAPPLTLSQPFTNISFDVGVMTGRNSPTQGCDGDGCRQYETPTDFIPLTEGDRFLAIGGQPMGFRVETMSSGLANQASVFAKDWFAQVGLTHESHDILVSLHGRSGNTYWCLRRDVNPAPGFCYLPATYLSPFAEGLMQVASAKQLAADKGKSYVVRAVTAIHGGSDHYGNESELPNLSRNDGQGVVGNYAGALLEWQRDYEDEVRAITGQAEPIPLFVSQFGSYTDKTVSRIPVRQLEAHVTAPGKVIVVTPNYPFVHYADCNHYTNHSQRRLGAYFAKAYQKVVVEGGTFEPLRPISVARADNVITVKFVVPVPPITFDTTRVVNPGNFGFTYADSAATPTIANVAITAPDTVTITLSAAPTGADRKLRYALNAPVPNACPGPTQGARGNLRDSDTTTGYHRDAQNNPYELFNWAVHFEVDVP
ncbi:MAG: hypothetical protein KF850_28850 [Labilithrix sp.]|nr:hypothetical protein [Labilithrix sp.]